MDFGCHFYSPPAPAYSFDAFNPNEPRVPSGPGAGEWTSGGGGGASAGQASPTTHEDRLGQIEKRVDELTATLEKTPTDPKAKLEMQGLMAEHESIINAKLHGPKYKTASELFTASHDPKITLADILAKQPPHAAEALASARKRLEGLPQTNAPVEKGGFKLPNGQYTPERATEVHNKILDKIFTDEAVAAARPPAGTRPTATFLGGRGGSGKSWFTRPGGPVDRGKAIYLNSDDIKEMLPEYQGWNAAQVHEEATDILNQVIDAARMAGLSVIIDATMKSEGTIGRYVSDFREAGYRTEGYYMHTSPEQAAQRAIERFLRGGKNGRYVPPELVMGSKSNEAVFDKLSRFMNKWALYDNNGQGNAPRFINAGENADV